MVVPEIVNNIIPLAGVVGIAFGAYQYVNTTKNKRQNERLKQLSEDLNILEDNISELMSVFESPTSKADLSHQLRSCATDIVAYKFESDNNAVVMSNLSGNINNINQAIDNIKNSTNIPSYRISLETGYQGYKNNMVYMTDEHSDNIHYIYNYMEKIQKDHKDILEEFSPGLYETVEDKLDDFTEKIYTEFLQNSQGIEINPEDYVRIEDISEDIFRYFWQYEGIESDLDDLRGITEEIETVRTRVLQASYS